ncbi:MAG: DUF2500 family protein [Clostridia bacterium]|nr:DUF2500 family protein [Clostridia bacterium]
MVNIINVLFVFLFSAVLVVFAFARIAAERYGKNVTVDALVVDKQRYTKTVYAHSSGAVKKTECNVTFLCSGKRKSFCVSEFSYSGYRINEKGKLTYKGSRLIDFK